MKVEDSNKPIRIAQIIGKWNGGGVESVVMNYYRHIDRNKFQFDFIIDEDSRNVPIEKIEKLGGKIIFVPPYQKPFKYIRALKKVFKENKYRIVHSHINTLSVFPLYAAKKAGVKVRIAHSHSTTNKKEPLRNFLKNFLRLFSKKYATDYFACSELAGRYQFGNKTFDQGKVTIIHNAIDIEKFKPNKKIREEIRKEFGAKEDTLVIGHVGRFVKQKNHNFLINVFSEVYKQNPNSILVLAGEGPLLLQTINQVKKLGLEKSVKFLGQRKDIEKVYQAMDVFCLPSLYEGLPVTGLEAQISGKKCIFSDKITSEVKISQTTKMLSIKKISQWKKEILSESIPSKYEINPTYNISEQAKKLNNFYATKNKKIVIHLISTNIYSGAENVACQIISSFEKYNDHYDSFYMSQKGAISKILRENKIQHIEIKDFSIKEVKKSFKKYQPDTVHAHDTKSIIMAVIASQKQSKIIGHIHGNHENLRKLTLKSILLKMASVKLSKIIWVSKSALDNYYFAKNKKISEISIILYNSIDAKNIKKKSEDSKNKTQYDILYIGRFTYPKNPQLFVDIVKEVAKTNPNIKTAMIGQGDLFENTKSLIEKNNLQKNIDTLGFIDNPYGILSKAKILLMTSRYEGLPMVILEALALNVPFISTPVDGAKEILQKYKCGYIGNSNTEIIDHINDLLKNEELSKKTQLEIAKANNYYNDMQKYSNTILRLYMEAQ